MPMFGASSTAHAASSSSVPAIARYSMNVGAATSRIWNQAVSRCVRPQRFNISNNHASAPWQGPICLLPPHVTHIRKLFLVPASVSEFHRDASVPFVEAPRARVGLKSPELEAIGPLAFHMIEERRAHSVVLPFRIDMKLHQAVVLQAGQPNDAPVSHSHPHLVL